MRLAVVRPGVVLVAPIPASIMPGTFSVMAVVTILPPVLGALGRALGRALGSAVVLRAFRPFVGTASLPFLP
jgi:hypothetical protein